MSASAYLAALLRVAVPGLAVIYAAHRLRSRLTGLAGAAGVLADAVIALSLVLVLAEGSGLVSALRTPALIGLPVAIALAVGVWDRRRTWTAPDDAPALDAVPDGAAGRPPGAPAWRSVLRDLPTVAALVGVTVVSAQWALETARSLDTGISSFDSLWYHMPFAAGFAQAASVTGVQYTQTDPLIAFFPDNSELLHGVGIVLLHSDLASPLLNLGWMSLALLAGWCIGRPWNAGPATLAAVALVLATPVMGTSQPGEAGNDIVGLAMILAATALVVGRRAQSVARPADLAVAGLAAGFAIGTKVTFLVPAIALVASGVAFAPAGRRRSAALALTVGLTVTGSYWYLRNLVTIGNPFGVLGVHLGPVTLAAPQSPLERVFHHSLISYIGETGLWTSRLAPGLHQALGPLWWAIGPAAAVAAVLLLVAAREPGPRVLALTALVSAAGYTVLPTSASFLEINSQTFSFNTRYATPALALGLAALALLAPARPDRRGATWLAPTLVAAILGTQLAGTLWPDQVGRHAAALLIGLGLTAALAAALPGLRRSVRSAPATLVAVLALGLAAAAGGGYLVQRHYLENRYQKYAHDAALARVFRWAQPVRNARIAVAGTVLSYPLYGRDLSNRVTYVGHRTPRGGFGPAVDCAEWRAGLMRGHFDYVVVTPTNLVARRASPEELWTRADTSASVALDAGGRDLVFRITGALHPCSAAR